MTYEALPPHGRAPMLENRAPCRWCGSPTLIATLSHYGARCLSCFEAYLAERHPTPDTGDKRKYRLSWAEALKRRHDAGARLPPASIAMYRAALGRGVTDAGEP